MYPVWIRVTVSYRIPPVARPVGVRQTDRQTFDDWVTHIACMGST